MLVRMDIVTLISDGASAIPGCLIIRNDGVPVSGNFIISIIYITSGSHLILANPIQTARSSAASGEDYQFK
jgi:hypothetical protein